MATTTTDNTTRRLAIEWFNSLSPENMADIFVTAVNKKIVLGGGDRTINSLTGKEIEAIYTSALNHVTKLAPTPAPTTARNPHDITARRKELEKDCLNFLRKNIQEYNKGNNLYPKAQERPFLPVHPEVELLVTTFDHFQTYRVTEVYTSGVTVGSSATGSIAVEELTEFAYLPWDNLLPLSIFLVVEQVENMRKDFPQHYNPTSTKDNNIIVIGQGSIINNGQWRRNSNTVTNTPGNS